MPIRCTFDLNRERVSTLNCPGFGTIPAFSGKGRARDNPEATGLKGVGPIPKGTYYIVDRQSAAISADFTTLGASRVVGYHRSHQVVYVVECEHRRHDFCRESKARAFSDSPDGAAPF